MFISSMSAISKRSVTDTCAPHPLKGNKKKGGGGSSKTSVVEWRLGRMEKEDERERVIQGKKASSNIPKNASVALAGGKEDADQ